MHKLWRNTDIHKELSENARTLLNHLQNARSLTSDKEINFQQKISTKVERTYQIVTTCEKDSIKVINYIPWPIKA